MSANIKSELTAIRESAAIFPLDGLNARAFLRITGEDATRWLNGMVTNSIQSLQPGEGNYNFLLNAQGRIQGDCIIYRDGDEFLLETQNSKLETVKQHLDRFIIMDDVELTPLKMTGVGIIGPAAGRLAFELWDPIHAKAAPEPAPVGEMRRSPYRGGQQIFLYPPSSESLKSAINRVEIWSTDRQETLVTERALLENGAAQISAEAREAFRILSGTPRFGQDIRERDLPQETNQTHALHFTKGCYLGQEIVERIHSRGQVHRTFTGFRLTALPATLPAPLTSEGKSVGEITSAAVVPLPEGDAILALGYARREVLDRNTPLAYEGGTATPAALPFRPS
jgi:folate-binding protein YgfZ